MAIYSPHEQDVSGSCVDIDIVASTQTSSMKRPSVIVAGDLQNKAFEPERQQTSSPEIISCTAPFDTTHLSPTKCLDAIDDFMHMNDDMGDHQTSYQDLLSWSDYPLEFDVYDNTMNMVNDGSVSCLNFADVTHSGSGPEASITPSEITSTSSTHDRSTSVVSRPESEYDFQLRHRTPANSEPLGAPAVPELDVVIAAQAAWPFARCNPPIYSSSCPRTAILHLESLEQNSKHDDAWRYLDMSELIKSTDERKIIISTIACGTRDKILAITQGFLHKALAIHRGGLNGWPKGYNYPNPSTFNFLMLPPSNVLEFFLRRYVKSLTCYYTLISGGTVDPNLMMHNNQASTLLVLLMIAQGATTIPTAEARYLTGGLIETCRISLFDIVEKDVELSADPTVLRCALLFTILGAWSGDKWHMDIAMGQRGMYLAVSVLLLDLTCTESEIVQDVETCWYA